MSVMTGKVNPKVIRCLDCIHCILDKKKCRPESKDCEKEYNLTTKDINIYRDNDCDFYHQKPERGDKISEN